MSTALTTTAERPERGVCTLLNWAPTVGNQSALIGRADVCFAGGWIVRAVPIFQRADGSLSAGSPSCPQVDADGRVKLVDGKRQYRAVEFHSPAARSAWSRAVLTALAQAGITGGTP